MDSGKCPEGFTHPGWAERTTEPRGKREDMLAVTSSTEGRGLDWLIAELDALNSVVDEPTCRRLLAQCSLSPADVVSHVERREGSYARRHIVRREHYEVLVLTWMPGQGSVAHDHSGSVCGLTVVEGRLTEHRYESGPDGQVRPVGSHQVETGEVIVDPGTAVHSLSNPADSPGLLVTVHIYSPPLPEVRRYAVASEPPAGVFTREKAAGARTLAIIGGGFTGSMTLANLLRRAPEAGGAWHLVLIDRMAAVGDGVAYRTHDARHLLNVPAGRMSAWPDQPEDFLNHARKRDPSVQPGDFLPRQGYGDYVRKALLDAARSAGPGISAEIIRDEAAFLGCRQPGWTVSTAKGRTVEADVVIVALGHRPPGDDFHKRWKGPRNRWISDPWASLSLSQIRPDEPVLILGSGLTAMDAVLTLGARDRSAPLLLVSRRGLLPQPHSRQPIPPLDCNALVDGWLKGPGRLTVRRLLRTLRGHADLIQEQGGDWRQVVDGIRPFIQKIWRRLDIIERERLLRHARPFWEIHRHRMPPAVADKLKELKAAGVLELAAGTLLGAEADEQGVRVVLGRRGRTGSQSHRVAWVINCTGPGPQNRHTTHPILRPLIQSGALCDDPLGLGILTDADGRALLRNGKAHPDLLFAGTLRKADLWESTAVPELRGQAARVAEVAVEWASNLGSEP